MTADELYNKVLDKAKEFGMVPVNSGRDVIDANGDTVIRKNIADDTYGAGKAYFGFVNAGEELSNQYSDFSFVIFPEKELGACVVSLCVGSSGFRKDYELASEPGLRRMFLKLRTNDNTTFFKTSFDDIESTSSELLKEIKANYHGLTNVIERYKKVLPAARIIDFNVLGEEKAMNIIYEWLTVYADVRGWGTNAQHKQREIELNKITAPQVANEEDEVYELLLNRRFVVLQGAPGTGKTYTALQIAKKYFGKPFFDQFHAETTYSDFVYGIEPNLDKKDGGPQFKPKKGILYQAIEYAMQESEKKVLLIIDEINRANLPNVLGPVFFLFENNADNRKKEVETKNNVTIRIGDRELTELPKNLYVIATMNTADRSLAVVDFALRRRFAWYTMRPHEIVCDSEHVFMSDQFNEFSDIFFRYASDEELNLQPGQSYFIVKKSNLKLKKDREEEQKEAMAVRMEYELMPLIKEYLQEGYLQKARDAFSNLFLNETGKLMYE